MASMAALLVSRRKVRGMSQKMCCGPRCIAFPVSVISSMLAMAGLSSRRKDVIFMDCCIEKTFAQGVMYVPTFNTPAEL